MLIFLDESGDLGWSFDKPHTKGGSSRYITIAGVVVEQEHLKYLSRYIHDLYKEYSIESHSETKGSRFSNADAASIVSSMRKICDALPSFEIISITSNKLNVISPLRRDQMVFYNHMLNVLLTDLIRKHNDVNIVLDNRTIRSGSVNSFEDCLRAKCWGELQLDANISCRYEDSTRNPGIWVADWLANFIWRHYENKMHDAWLECHAQAGRYHERTLFM